MLDGTTAAAFCALVPAGVVVTIGLGAVTGEFLNATGATIGDLLDPR